MMTALGSYKYLTHFHDLKTHPEKHQEQNQVHVFITLAEQWPHRVVRLSVKVYHCDNSDISMMKSKMIKPGHLKL